MKRFVSLVTFLLLPLAAIAGEKSLPQVRAITKGPKFHWFGYYDKFQFDPTDRYVLGMEVEFEHRSPMPDDVIKVGMVDLQDGDKWIELGQTRAWNWQQGCMLQWVPGAKSEILWNDRDGEKFVCHIMDVHTKKKRTIPFAIYTVSPDGAWGLSTDFRRLNDMRPGYGYAGIADPNKEVAAPKDSGIWKVDLKTGEAKLIISVEKAAAVPFAKGFLKGFSKDAKHWFNHLLVAPDGKRFIFLHRWRGAVEGKGFSTRMFTADPDGENLYVLDPRGRTSHFIWRDAEHVAAWALHFSHGERFYLYKDRTDQVEVIGKDVMTQNGHLTYLPGNEFILNDTYPDAKRLQHVYLFHVATGKKTALGSFRSPPEYTGEWRCDTHPRFSRDGKMVVIDSPHEKGRQMYLITLP